MRGDASPKIVLPDSPLLIPVRQHPPCWMLSMLTSLVLPIAFAAIVLMTFVVLMVDLTVGNGRGQRDHSETL